MLASPRFVYCWLLVCVSLVRCSFAQDVLPSVVLADVVSLEINAGHRVVGSVSPLRTSTIGSAVAGRVLEFNVNQGAAVKEGQAMAQLMTQTLEIELAAAKSELELYRQQLLEQQNGSRAEDIAEAQANAMGAKAAMDNAANQLRRMQTLVSSRAATDTDLEDARERARMTGFAYAAADALLQRIKSGPRSEQVAQARARVELQEHNVALIEDRIAKHTIRAPFNGFVSLEYTQIGAWISSGDPIVQVIQLDEVEIQAPVTADYATKLREGDTVRVDFPELPDQLLMGTIDRIVPVADSRARTFPVMIRMTNPLRDGRPLLMAGMLARIDLPAGQRKALPLVPKDALVLNESERAIFVFDPDPSKPTSSGQVRQGRVRRVPVELGVAFQDLIQVSGDIAVGQSVVVVGNERLADGARVQTQ